MRADRRSTRRRLLCALATAGVTVAVAGCSTERTGAGPGEDAKGGGAGDVLPNEDLMREHGVLRRLLLVYQECGRRLERGEELPAEVLRRSTELVRDFIENYHEKLEENYLFPRFERAGKLVELVDTLKRQHEAGRRLTQSIAGSATAEGLRDAATRTRVVREMQQFAAMYRPHAAREDTVLFPAFRQIVSAQEYAQLGDQFEDRERQLFGEDGFEKIVGRVADLERSLGIYDLAQFTPA